jgi:hypothetical protein
MTDPTIDVVHAEVIMFHHDRPGADAAKVSTPMTAICGPTNNLQPREAPASNAGGAMGIESTVEAVIGAVCLLLVIERGMS